MAVIDKLPTKAGQRVQDVFTDSRGWVIDTGSRNGQKVAHVEWDEPAPGLGTDDSVFPVDALRVVEVIMIDADRWEDPSTHPMVESTHTGTGETVFNIKGGTVLRSLAVMRNWLVGFHTTDRA